MAKTDMKAPRRALLVVIAAVMGLLAMLPAGCGTPGPHGPADTYDVDFSLPPGASTTGAIVFFLDGVNAEVFQEMLEADELPAIRKYFVDRGLYCPRAIANTPSVTLANLTSFVTGQFPGHHGVTGINWFDRNRLVWRNYETIAQKNTLDGDYIAPNIYEQFPGRTTLSVFFQPHRRTTKFFENWTSAGPPFFFGWYEFVDRLTLFRLNEVMALARQRRAMPAVTIAYLLAPDFRAYGHGVSSSDYRQALKHTDYQIGRVLGDVKRAGLLDKLIIALVSDHSLMDVKQHFPIEPFLQEQLGLHVATGRLWEQTPFEKRSDHYGRYAAVLYGSGDRYWAICLRKPVLQPDESVRFEPWTVRPNAGDLQAYPVAKTTGVARWFAPTVMPTAGANRVDLLEALVSRQAVDAIAYAVAPNRVRVRTARGEVEFRQCAGRGGDISYHAIQGDDPFGWEQSVPDGVLDGTSMSGREWLAVTARTQFPDLPAQIVAYFRARRAGDIAVFAAPGWDFFDRNAAGHGGLRPGDMLVPILLAGPGIPTAKRTGPTRVADVMPTLLRLLGRPVPPGLDGQPIPETARP